MRARLLALAILFLSAGIPASWFVLPAPAERGDAIEIEGPQVEKETSVEIRWNDYRVHAETIRAGEKIRFSLPDTIRLPSGTYAIHVPPFRDPVESFRLEKSRAGAMWIVKPARVVPVSIEKGVETTIEFRVTDAGSAVYDARCDVFFGETVSPCLPRGDGVFAARLRAAKTMHSGFHSFAVVLSSLDGRAGGEFASEMRVQAWSPIVDVGAFESSESDGLVRWRVQALYPDATPYRGTLTLAFDEPIDERGNTTVEVAAEDGDFRTAFSTRFFKSEAIHVHIELRDGFENDWSQTRTLVRPLPWHERPVGPFSLLLTGVFLAIGFGLLLDGVVRVVQIRRYRHRLKELRAEKKNTIENFELLRSMDALTFETRIRATEAEIARARQKLIEFDAEE